jgi:hypothetical protein
MRNPIRNKGFNVSHTRAADDKPNNAYDIASEGKSASPVVKKMTPQITWKTSPDASGYA